VLMGYTISQ